MRQKHPQEVENYTDAFLASLGLIIFLSLVLLQAFAGPFYALIAAISFDWAVQRFRPA